MAKQNKNIFCTNTRVVYFDLFLFTKVVNYIQQFWFQQQLNWESIIMYIRTDYSN